MRKKVDSVGSRKDAGEDLSQTSQILLTKEEKEQFLSALEKNGLNVVYNLDKLSKYLPNRSKTELKYCVDIYNRRGHAKITEDEKDQQKSESGHEEEDSESQLDPSSVRCENWFKVVYGCVSFNSKRSDLSNCLTKIVAKMADQVDNQMEIDDEEEDNDGVDYKAIYHFLAHLFANKYPKELEKREALVLLSLIENLTNNIHDIDTTSEESVIKSASWWKTEDSENTANNLVKQSLPSHQTDDNTAHQAKRPTEDNPMSCSSLSEEEESSLTSYFDLPKIRKIRECLNPLKIPVNLLANEHRLLSLFFE